MMGRQDWCIRCGRRIDPNRLVCHHCGMTQPQISEFEGDVPTLTERYKDLIYIQSTRGLTDKEYIELEQIRGKLNGR
jgi:hypothetical protein